MASPASKATSHSALSLPPEENPIQLGADRPGNGQPIGILTSPVEAANPCAAKSTPPLQSIIVQASETVSMPTPGIVYFLPLNLQDVQLSSSAPLMFYPHRDLISLGVLASPFLLSAPEMDSLALICIPDNPLTIQRGSDAAVVIPVPSELGSPKCEEFSPHEGIPWKDVLYSSPVSSAKPLLLFYLNGIPFSGILDTGADVTVIQTSLWPAEWPLQSSPAVKGVGGVQTAQASVAWVVATTPPSKIKARIRPVVLPLHVNLWGRDLLSQFNASLSFD